MTFWRVRRPQREAVLAWALLVGLALLWGSSFILIKKAVAVYLPLAMGTLRIVAAGAVLLPVAVALLLPGRRLALSARQWLFLAVSGLLGSLLPAVLFALAGRHTDSAVVGSINALTPLFTLTVGGLFFRRRVAPVAVAGLLVGLAGAMLLLFGGTPGRLALNAYALCAVAATLCYGINLNLIKTHLHQVRPLHLTALSLLLVLPLATGYFFGTGAAATAVQPGGALPTLYAVVLGVMGTAVALVFFNKLVQMTTPLFASSVTYLIPLVALGWGLYDGETLAGGQLLGMAAVVGGVLLVSRR